MHSRTRNGRTSEKRFPFIFAFFLFFSVNKLHERSFRKSHSSFFSAAFKGPTPNNNKRNESNPRELYIKFEPNFSSQTFYGLEQTLLVRRASISVKSNAEHGVLLRACGIANEASLRVVGLNAQVECILCGNRKLS